MTDHTHTNPDRDPVSERLDLATLIRCAADDCLSTDQADALRAHLEAHPEDQARIDFERSLRDATCAAMHTDPAPAELRQKIESMLTERRQPETVGPRATRDRSFWRRSFLPLAAAAMVLMAFGVSLMVTNQSQSRDWSDGLGASVVGWVEREHRKCCESAKYRQSKLSTTNVSDVQELIRRDLGAVPRQIQLDNAGYTFAGYGSCNIPGGGPSGQMVYTPNDGNGYPISLFIQRDDGQLDGVATTSDCIKGSVGDLNKRTGGLPTDGSTGIQASDQIFIWRADGLIYYLVTNENNKALPCLESLGAPGNHISL